MIEIVHNAEIIHEKLNKTFAALGLPLKSEDFVVPDMLCVSIASKDNDLYKVQTILKQEDIETTVSSIPTGLEWIPYIYYINVSKGEVRKAIALLEHLKFQSADLSEYFENMARSRSRNEHLLTWVGLTFISGIAVLVGYITVEAFLLKRWDAVILFGLLILGFMVLGLCVIKVIRKQKKGEKRKESALDSQTEGSSEPERGT